VATIERGTAAAQLRVATIERGDPNLLLRLLLLRLRGRRRWQWQEQAAAVGSSHVGRTNHKYDTRNNKGKAHISYAALCW
jgi:hypothetical protein